MASLSRLLPRSLRRRLALRSYREALSRLTRVRQAPHQAQHESLQAIVLRNRQTEFGKAHGFARIRGVDDYVAQVPLRSPKEFEPFLEREAAGQQDILVRGPLCGVALCPDPLGHRQPLPLSTDGKQHWHFAEQLVEHATISLREEAVEGEWAEILPAHPVGKDGRGPKRSSIPELMGSLRAGATRNPLPAALFSLLDDDRRYYLILRILLARPLSVLRTANPGTLTLLAERLATEAEGLIEDLAVGQINSEGLPENIQEQLPTTKSEPELAEKLRKYLRQHGRLLPRHVWPDLAVLICDTTGPARQAAKRLPDHYGDIAICDPGLVVANTTLTLPSPIQQQGGLVLLDGQFLEFLPAADSASQPTIGADNLQLGQRYRIAVTHSSGLYRQLQPLMVQVCEIEGQIPRLAVVGHCPQSMMLADQELGQELFNQLLLDAARGGDTLLAGHCAWLEQANPQEVDDEPPSGFWGRLWQRKSSATAEPKERVELVVLLEAEDSLEGDVLRRLAADLHQQLQRGHEGYRQLAAEQKLVLRTISLRRGTFAQRAQQQLLRAEPYGHWPLPPILPKPWAYPQDQVVDSHLCI